MISRLKGIIVRKGKRLFEFLAYDIVTYKCDLVILDDFFPNPLSYFRYIEFEKYLENFDTILFTNGAALQLVAQNPNLKELISNYECTHKTQRIKIYNPRIRLRAKIAYIVFLGNMYGFLKYVEANRIFFVFTLYPGGGFLLNNEISNNQLKRIFSSPFFRRVIVTQKITFNYLIKNKLCEEKDIEFIYGGPFDIKGLSHSGGKKHYPIEKETFDICFVGAKYEQRGKDKGYDLFIETAKILRSKRNIYFHVVGGFSCADIDVSILGEKIKFYNYLNRTELGQFFLTKDIIISPNRSNVLAIGSFDGFPTASVIEAGLHKVSMFVSDDLNQNTVLKENYEIVIIDHSPINIAQKVLHYYTNPEENIILATNGYLKLVDEFSEERQITPRLKIVHQMIDYYG